MAANTRILLVEDDPDTREITGLLLLSQGYEVIEAYDAATALAAIDCPPGIDLIVADICLGRGRSGVTMALEIRRRGLNIPIIMISGDLEGAIAAQGIDAVFLPKPYGRRALLAAVSAIDRRHNCSGARVDPRERRRRAR
ncbi:response regulator [Rhodanobacter sp. T12-5]|uniref:response regulator transcription factor n=1 Tax=Rhodanobacter sp. T12-5 TaxID=2024611 RepID=UPI0011EF7D36|nr:response regulator [Rhodanobacter sp. T12-5]KAA0070286.1 response regulator [Rhodanobacter sp. T12-5]